MKSNRVTRLKEANEVGMIINNYQTILENAMPRKLKIKDIRDLNHDLDDNQDNLSIENMLKTKRSNS